MGHVSTEIVPREFMGRARAFLRAVDVESWEVMDCLGDILAPIMKRMRNKPGIRPEHMVELRRGWQALPSQFRIDLKVYRNAIFDTRLTRTEIFKSKEEGDWIHTEERIVVIKLGIIADKKRVEYVSEYLGTANLHAMARWYQRNTGDKSEASLMRDLALIGHEPTEEDTFIRKTPNGQWRGIYTTTPNRVMKNKQVVPQARTWLHDEMIAD